MVPPPPPAKVQLVTIAEQSGWKKTGRYAEVAALCADFQKAYPGKTRCLEFGRTPEGRPLLALVASADGVLDPASANKKGRPIVLAQGGIHAGEIEGKDAGFWLLRDLLDGKALPGVLEKLTFVFVPVFNADGHERFGPNNRPNQRGPEEMGWRVTAQNLNLNRDYVKAEAPEMKAMLRLLGAWDPILYVDLHATDGAKFEHDVSVLVEPGHGGPPELEKFARAARSAMRAKLEGQGHLPIVEFYPDFEKKDDPASGFSVRPGSPRFSNGYWPLRNRLAVLVETHSWKDYANRIRSTRDVVLGLLELAAKDGKEWTKAARALDAADRVPGDVDVPLAWEFSGKPRTIDFRGFAYTREPSAVSGQVWIRYDESRPEVWKVPFVDESRPSIVARLPKGGYLVPAAWAEVVGEKLKLHGFSFSVLRKPLPVEADVFRAAQADFKAKPFEGHQLVELKGAWSRERRELPAGSLFVPAAQRGRRLLAHLLDPQGHDSLAGWGFFNAAFEQKEYMEDYVVEEEARRMLAQNPALKAEFEKKVKDDPAFAKDPAARLNFFYRRHPSWDERKDLYPVYRVQNEPK